MMLLYPYTKLAQFEIEVKPKGYFLILAIKIDNTIPCKFNLKNFFKTFKYNPDNSKQTVAQPQFNFVEFCSKDIKEEEITFTYYDFLNDDNVNPPSSISNIKKQRLQRFAKVVSIIWLQGYNATIRLQKSDSAACTASASLLLLNKQRDVFTLMQ